MSYESWRISYQSSEQAARAAYAEVEKLRKEDYKLVPVDVRNVILDALNRVHAEGWAGIESAMDEIADRLTALATQEPRACTCHPEDRPDGPCRERYAASECLALAATAPLQAEIDKLRREVEEWKSLAEAQVELRDEAEDHAEDLAKALAGLITWIPSADTYRRLGFDPEAPMRALKRAKLSLGGVRSA